MTLLTQEDINEKKAMLNILRDVGSAVTSQRKTRGSKAKAQIEPAEIDQLYSSLSCELTEVDPKSDEFAMIRTYTENTQGGRKCQLVDAFAVEGADAKGFAKMNKIGNRKLLWHGTNVAVVAAILKSGLRIMPHSGGRVGSGVYLASENGKSAGYCTANKHQGVMFLCEAALGKQREIKRDGEVNWHDKDPVSAHGANSVLAVGRTEPNPADDITAKFDKHDVTVPQGRVEGNPAGSSSSFSQSEYLVYNESQCRIRYVLKMKFETDGGYWH